MTDEQAKQYEKDCENCGNLDFPIVGGIQIMLCEICKNYEIESGTWKAPSCKALKSIPELIYRCDSYECPAFVHNPDHISNEFFDENFKPIPLK